MNSSEQRITSMGRAISFEQTTLNTSVVVSTTVPAKTQSCLVTANGAIVRWRCDGGNPSSTVGHALGDGQSIEFYGDDVKSAKFIASTGTPSIAVTYFS